MIDLCSYFCKFQEITAQIDLKIKQKVSSSKTKTLFIFPRSTKNYLYYHTGSSAKSKIVGH